MLQRKDITNESVCRAYALYQLAMEKFGFNNVIPSDCIRYPYEILMNWFDLPFDVCWRAMERASDEGFIEYGVSLRTGWLTDKGKQLLKEDQHV